MGLNEIKNTFFSSFGLILISAIILWKLGKKHTEDRKNILISLGLPARTHNSLNVRMKNCCNFLA